MCLGVEKLSGVLEVDSNPILCEQARKTLSVLNLLRSPIEVMTCLTGGQVNIDEEKPQIANLTPHLAQAALQRAARCCLFSSYLDPSLQLRML